MNSKNKMHTLNINFQHIFEENLLFHLFYIISVIKHYDNQLYAMIKIKLSNNNYFFLIKMKKH